MSSAISEPTAWLWIFAWSFPVLLERRTLHRHHIAITHSKRSGATPPSDCTFAALSPQHMVTAYITSYQVALSGD